MAKRNHYKLLIDEEFRRIVPPMPSERKEALERQIKYFGPEQDIITWHRIIIYGFEEYEICQKLGIPFSIQELDFDFRSMAINYASKKCLDLDYLSDEWNRYCIGKFYASKKQIFLDAYPIQNQFTPPEYKRPGNMLTSEVCIQELAGIRELKRGTITKYSNFSMAIDAIAEKQKEIAYDLLNGRFHLSHDNTLALSKLTPAEIVVVRDRIMNDGDLSILHSGTLRNHHVVKVKAETDGKRKKAPEIKQMPKYDPDAELSSLTLTIPSWISSIERTRNTADFEYVSKDAIYKMNLQLQILQEAIHILMEATKENSNE